MTNIQIRSGSILLIFLLLLITASGLRIAGLRLGMPDFEPVRQYHSALIARYLANLGNDNLPAWERDVIKQTMQPIHEPPIMESLAVSGYKLLGSEQLWWPRALASISWIAGGFVLWRLLQQLFSPGAALFGTAFYLLAPYGIRQSLSFQPDSLALAITLAACLGILRFHRAPNQANLFRAALICAVAVLVKTQFVFLIAGVYAALGLLRGSLWRLLSHRDNLLFALLALAPVVLYLIINMQMGGIAAQRGIIPAALIQPSFYISWLYNLDKVYGFPIFIMGLIGTILLRGETLAMALGLWGGYLVLGMVFTFHFATHTYYQVSAFPALAFGLAGLATPLIESWRGQQKRFAVSGLLLVGGLSLLLLMAPTIKEFGKPGIESRAEAYSEIGRLIEHSRRVLMLTESEGFPLMYHAKIAGDLWPTQWSLAVEQAGYKSIAQRDTEGTYFEYEVAERFARYAQLAPEFFVITKLHEFAPSLERYLAQSYPLLAATDVYRIYDLRKPFSAQSMVKPMSSMPPSTASLVQP